MKHAGNNASLTASDPTGVLRAVTGSDLVELTKPGITKMVVFSTGVGFIIAGIGVPWNPLTLGLSLVAALVFTAFSAAGANALNEWMERDLDKLMPRTKDRPIPSGRVPARTGLAVGLSLCIVGVVGLLLTVNAAAATVSAVTILTYLLLYTPSKTRSPLSTVVGAFPGALPPLIGWAAAQPDALAAWYSLLDPGPWTIFAIMFVWQIPHVMAISWRYRDDYEKAGIKVLPVLDPAGERTGATMLLWTATLIPVSISPPHLLPGRLGWGYAIIAVVVGLVYLFSAARFAIRRDDTSARIVFFASIIYLPVLMIAMVIDAVLIAIL